MATDTYKFDYVMPLKAIVLISIDMYKFDYVMILKAIKLMVTDTYKFNYNNNHPHPYSHK